MHASVARDGSPALQASPACGPAEQQANASPACSPSELRSAGRAPAFGLYGGLTLIGLLALVLGPELALPPPATQSVPDRSVRVNTERSDPALRAPAPTPSTATSRATRPPAIDPAPAEPIPGDGRAASRPTDRPAAAHQAPDQAPPLQSPTDRPAPDARSPEALAALNRVRAQPQQCGAQWMPAVGPVRWNPQATKAAQDQAQYLQRSNRFGHAGEQGSHVGQRLAATGLRWRKAGENLAAGQDDLSEVLSNWLASPSHCRVLMTAEFDLAGLAHVPGHERNTYASYWALVLAATLPDPEIGPLALSQ
jgi:uncharacterized protein YkwD